MSKTAIFDIESSTKAFKNISMSKFPLFDIETLWKHRIPQPY
jgi:hypothetical protein